MELLRCILYRHGHSTQSSDLRCRDKKRWQMEERGKENSGKEEAEDMMI